MWARSTSEVVDFDSRKLGKFVSDLALI
ncbi:hypothetical protein RRG08_009184 [Elysia crispata]|uniref:Uncharacterized protein n=1 Tax=Elysia crispata TaxID=231223 RepID=A0AAE0ZPS4_9GAST|nr:hypothetical protein RRG08_009184 [Elysia crispata]